MTRFQFGVLLLVGFLTAGANSLNASPGQDVPIPERAKGAARIVVATVSETTARYERNPFGDELIVTYAALSVEEAIKGSADPTTVVLEGGTVDGITLRVSDLPSLGRGDRAVFFLTGEQKGTAHPHLRGQGILKLDERDHILDSSLTLDDVRRLARQSSK